jgi:hypothetical protein
MRVAMILYTTFIASFEVFTPHLLAYLFKACGFGQYFCTFAELLSTTITAIAFIVTLL